MLGISGFKTKKSLKDAARSDLGVNFSHHVVETSMFGKEYAGKPGTYVVVGPSVNIRKWYAQVTVDAAGIVTKVA